MDTNANRKYTRVNQAKKKKKLQIDICCLKFKVRLYIVPPRLIHSIWKVSIKLDSKKADRHANIDMGFPDPRCEGVLFEKQAEMEEKCFLVPIENLYRSFQFIKFKGRSK